MRLRNLIGLEENFEGGKKLLNKVNEYSIKDPKKISVSSNLSKRAFKTQQSQNISKSEILPKYEHDESESDEE